MTWARRKLPELLATLVMSVWLLVGWSVIPDYGLNWDDGQQRTIGLMNWTFLTTDSGEWLRGAPDRYHGPAAELLLIAVEKVMNRAEPRDVHLDRHRTSFLLFALGVAAFFFLCRKVFDSSWLGLAGLLLLLTSPRLFGEGFYNMKDTTFLAATVLALHSLVWVLDRPTVLRMIWHAATCAFMVDIRIIGIIFVPLTVAWLLLRVWQRRFTLRLVLPLLAVYLLLGFVLVVAMWPILRDGPITHLWAAYKQLSDYTAWDGYTRYLGQCVHSIATPWHYHWVWIAVTTPELQLVLFLIGTALLLLSPRSVTRSDKLGFLLVCLLLLLFPLVFRSVKGSSVYDGWRHVYFVYPYVVMLGLLALERLVQVKHRMWRAVAFAVCGVALADNAAQLVSTHPFQYVYFNRVANAALGPMEQQFDMDYWGVSYAAGLQSLATLDPSGHQVTVGFTDAIGRSNYEFTQSSLRTRVLMTESPEYLLTYRRDCGAAGPAPAPAGQLVRALRVQGNTVMSLYRVR